MKLIFGVVDVQYELEDTSPAKTARQIKAQKRNDVRAAFGLTEYNINKTTGDVANILEDEYHVMEHFYEAKKTEIAGAFEQSLGDAVEALMMGTGAASDPFAAASSDIEAQFKHFLSQRELDSLGYPGIPTKAAQNGVSHRFKHPYAKRAPRPSFIDTGLYEASFKAWTEK